jgi:death on curing protein
LRLLSFLASFAQAIQQFHDYTIQRHGGLPGFRDKNQFLSAVERPWITLFGVEAFQTPFQKAAAVADSIVRTHPFNDANHRTAVAAAYVLLGLLGWQLVASKEDHLATIRALGLTMTMEGYSDWLQQNSVVRSTVGAN